MAVIGPLAFDPGGCDERLQFFDGSFEFDGHRQPLILNRSVDLKHSVLEPFDDAVQVREQLFIEHSELIGPLDLSHGRCPKMKRARSWRSISNGVIHLMPRPMQALGILIFFVEAEAISWVTTV